jgi:uncharacterized membrane protein (DUF2068 family)
MNEGKGFLVRKFGLRGIAILEAVKGCLALVLGFIMLSFRHKDLQMVARHILGFLHVNPDRHFYHEVLRAASRVTSHGLVLFLFGSIIYALIRFAEAVGLWFAREWAEWFALISSAVYLPWEIYELIRRHSWVQWTVLGVNLLIVLYLLGLRIEQHRAKKAKQVGSQSHRDIEISGRHGSAEELG